MARLATSLAQDAATAIENRDPRCVERLINVEEEMKTLHRQIFQRLFAQEWSHGVEPAVDAALMGRYYARFADHALAIARQAKLHHHRVTTASVTHRGFAATGRRP